VIYVLITINHRHRLTLEQHSLEAYPDSVLDSTAFIRHWTDPLVFSMRAFIMLCFKMAADCN